MTTPSGDTRRRIMIVPWMPWRVGLHAINVLRFNSNVYRIRTELSKGEYLNLGDVYYTNNSHFHNKLKRPYVQIIVIKTWKISEYLGCLLHVQSIFCQMTILSSSKANSPERNRIHGSQSLSNVTRRRITITTCNISMFCLSHQTFIELDQYGQKANMKYERYRKCMETSYCHTHQQHFAHCTYPWWLLVKKLTCLWNPINTGWDQCTQARTTLHISVYHWIFTLDTGNIYLFI